MALPTTEAIFAHLRGVDLFADLPDSALRELIQQARLLAPSPGEVIFEAGSLEDSILVILSGTVTIFHHRKVIRQLLEGEYFGEVALVEQAPRSASARAGEGTVLLELPSASCRDLLERDPAFRRGATRMLCRRLRESTERVIHQSERMQNQVHDMRNLLWMLDYARLVAEELPEDDPHRNLLLRVRRAQTRLRDLAEGILESPAARVADRPPPRGNLEQLVRTCLEVDLSQHPELKRVRIEVEVLAQLPEFPFHPLEISRVLANLIVNAAEASPDGGVVRIELAEEQGQACVRIVDSGQGIPPELRTRIFDRHFSTKPGGYGLGLSSCREIVEGLHHGRLRFTSQPAVGTTFECCLPFSM